MQLTALDWIVIAITLIVCFAPSLLFGKRAGRSTSEFFVSGRAVPWWLAGLSMVATTFSSDTPNLVTDIVQFFIKMTAVTAAAYFALQAPQVGGLHNLVAKLSAMRGPGGVDYLSFLPDFRSNWDLAVAVFIMPIAVQWWAVWYPGAEPGGGSYVAQRMLASRSEKDSLGGTLFFTLAHYVLRPWPWILVGLASLIVYPSLDDIQRAFPH